jgi:hypothetical protein
MYQRLKQTKLINLASESAERILKRRKDKERILKTIYMYEDSI